MRRFPRFYLRWKARARARAHRGKVWTIPAVASPQLGNRRNLFVYTPASYARGDARYPVIYMQDGQNLFDAATSFAGDWGLKTALAWASRRGLEAIVVGIPNMGAARIDEYERHSKKKSRNYPRRKDEPSTGAPKILIASKTQRQKLCGLTQQALAA